MDSEKKYSVMSPRVEAEVGFREGRFYLVRMIHGDSKEEKCEEETYTFFTLDHVQGNKYVYCSKCYGNGHKEYYKKSSPVRHPLHPKHNLMFVRRDYSYDRKCICCEDSLKDLFYCCPSCDFGINFACVVKQPLITIYHRKRHEHTLTLFPRQVTTSCNVCGLADSRISPIYICPACDFVVHKRCIYLPWIIRISRHPRHRLSFTSSFSEGDKFCNICRKTINNDYGGYICNEEGCSYFAHSKCATGKNVWDGQELEGVLEEVEEEEETFERLGNGMIRHFSHTLHPLKLNEEDATRDYDEYRSCEACIMPIYYGNFYSCTLDCSFILHEVCANMSRRIYSAIHPHPLVLRIASHEFLRCCSACGKWSSGFFFECGKCDFRLHVQCAMIYEPLMHNSHVHPLFLTSAPEESKTCSICKDSGARIGTNETFNCIESKCEFSLCYKCAVLPQKVRYKHDYHVLTLFYGKESSEIQNWCELCEIKIKPGERLYACEDCCVTLHIECLLGRDMNFRLGSYTDDCYGPYDIIPNNGMTRPKCSFCGKRCNQRMVFKKPGLQCCSDFCFDRGEGKLEEDREKEDRLKEGLIA